MLGRIAGTAVLYLIGALSIIHAQEIGPRDEYDRALRGLQTVSALGDNPFGEDIDLYTGRLTFNQADIVLEGTGPTISLVRTTAAVNNSEYRIAPNTLGNWMLSIPRIETLIDKDLTIPNSGSPGEQWTVYEGGRSYARCTKFDRPSYYGPIPDVWNGMDLFTEDGGRQTIMKRVPQNTLKPTMLDAQGQPMVFPAVTHAHWQIGCLPNTSNGEAGEGFLAVAPNGTKYWFDHLTATDALTVKSLEDGVMLRQRRMFATMSVSRIEDRFGNYLTYTYSGDKLQSITASDGRKVVLSWRIDVPLVASITSMPGSAQQRSWAYDYINPTTAPELSTVLLQDGSMWTFQGIGPVETVPPSYQFSACNLRTYSNAGTTYATITITTPSGLVGKFGRRAIVHARNYVPSACVTEQDGHPLPNPYEDVPVLFKNDGVVRKEIYGAGITSLVWTYKYPDAQGSTTEDACASTGTCPETKTVDVTNPAGDLTRYVLNTRYGFEGRLVKETRYQGSSSPLRTTDYGYASSSEGPYPSLLGDNMSGSGAFPPSDNRLTPQKTRTITQQGVTFKWQANNFDVYGRTRDVSRSSSLGTSGMSRREVTEYSDNTARWVLGQIASVKCTVSTPASTACDGDTTSQTTYDTNYALPLKTYAFGKLQQTLTYDTTSAVLTGQRGTVRTVVDGNGNTTTLSNWKRDIPGKVLFPSTPDQPTAVSQIAAINDDGTIASVTDENGYKTSYGYDTMGRLASITWPNDSPAWTATTQTFAPTTDPRYGLQVGHWWQVVKTGNGHKVVSFDALWRPVVEESYDNGNAAGTRSIVVKRYDAAGRLAFQSYPVRSLGLYTDTSLKGVRTEYDALGRITAVKQDSELGVLGATTEYLTGFKTKTTSPRHQGTGIATTASYMAWDQPTTDYPVALVHPAGAFTDISRDAFGKPTALKRRDAASSVGATITRSYTYDAAQQLCKTVEPETGATVQGYDGAGNVVWSASGLASSIACDAVPVGSRTTRSYDARNRIKALVFPDHRGDTTYAYAPDGRLATVETSDAAANNALTSYQYNKRRLLTSERLQTGGFDWTFRSVYHVDGYLASNTYPDGLVVDYAPNALGQPRKAGSYVGGVSYHPNGAMAGFTYGNGIVHTMTQNTRQLPEQSIDSGGVLNDSYDYDGNGNVAAISDGLSGQRGNRDMTYDDLDRLTTAQSKMFGTTGALETASYTYDVLDNLRTVSMPATPQTLARNHLYCYDAHFQLTFVRTAANCTSGDAVIALSYDGQGNLANKNNQLYVFDKGNRLRAMQLTSGSTPLETYAYDGHGRRVMASHDTQGTIWSQYGQDGVLRYQRNERVGKMTDYITLNGSLVARVNAAIAPGAPALSVPASTITGSYTVSWTTVPLATSYVLQEKTGSGSWGTVQTSSATSRAVTGKTAGIYTYRVQACNEGACGGWSNEGKTTVAAVPTLTVPETNTTGSYTASWTAVATATTYKLEERIGSTWTQVQNTSATSKALSGKAAGSYSYRVSACNGACGPASAVKTVSVTLPPTGTPTLTVPATNTTGGYTVSWTTVATATHYKLEEGIGSTWTPVQDTAATSKAFSGKAAGSYSYRVSACNTAGCGPVAVAKTVVVTLLPTTPPTLTVPATNTTGSYTASWTTVATATHYKLEEGIGSTWTPVQDTAAMSKTLSGKAAGSYSYRVSACNDAGCTATSLEKTVVVTLPPTGAPTVTVPATNTTGSYTASWTAVAAATSYRLEERVGSGVWAEIQNGASRTRAISGKGGGSYGYRARGCNIAGCGPYSAIKTTAVTLLPTGGPTLTAPPTSATGSYTVSWTAVATATSYRLEERIGSGAWAEIQNGATRARAISGKGNGSYGYRARGCNTAGCGPYSAIKTTVVTLPPAAAPALTVPASSTTGSYTASWTAVATATSYRLEERIGSGVWTEIQNGTGLSKAISGNGSASYGYRARGCNGSGCGPYSAIKTTTVQLIPAVPATLNGHIEVDSSERPPLITYYISWSAVSGATRYEVQETWLTNTTIVYSASGTNTEIYGRGSRSYTVRACNAAGCSAWHTPALDL
ncbi:RHS repeat protein [Luteimonas sp. 22616]|uniref:RHS repeat protein n=1 Tax=Luteimonas sp. 22616 TaxID=3453951 RepID=UPI003F8415F3